MRLETFHGRNVREAMAEVRRTLGDDALVVRTRGRPGEIEIVATTEIELDLFKAFLESPPRSRRHPRHRAKRRSRIVTLVGPTGSGKTTTAAKLALNERAFGGSRVGLISLDTYKIGAYDQIQTYADLARLPLEVLSDPREIKGALTRLSSCDVIVVDTPGRAPMAPAGEDGWKKLLSALDPDEVHLVLSAGLRTRVARAFLDHYADLAPTHVLLTKFDEVPDEDGVAELADRLALPARWITDGQSVPLDLHSASERLVAALTGGTGSAWRTGASA